MGMSWCMFIRARLLNRVAFVVLRRYVFNLRKQLKDLSAVSVETGIVRSTEKMVWMFGNKPVAYKPLKKANSSPEYKSKRVTSEA